VIFDGGTTMGIPTLDVNTAPVNAGEIRWATTDDRLFEDLDVNVGALSRSDLEIYAIELRDECRFLRTAWRSACQRVDGGAVCERYRADLAAVWQAEAHAR
jgi:hypothetical protein